MNAVSTGSYNEPLESLLLCCVRHSPVSRHFLPLIILWPLRQKRLVHPKRRLAIDRLKTKENLTWSESASEIYRPSDRRLSAKLVPAFEDTGCHVVGVMDPYGRNLAFIDRSRYFFYQVAPQLYS
jgi:hypothetical protein